MEEPHAHYIFEDGVALVEIRLNTPAQLFNSLDPSPFHEKDLDTDAEDYIIETVDDFPLSVPMKLVFYLPPTQVGSPEAAPMADAIHHYFRYALSSSHRKLRSTWRQARISLAIGIAFLFVCVIGRQILLLAMPDTLGLIGAEGLLIGGWVAMWRPLDTFLYGWWPARHLCRVYTKLAVIPVELRPISTVSAE
jgi:hypothetical protein